MASDLRDLRTKVSDQTDIALEAHARATGKDKAEIAREILHAWGVEQFHIATLMNRLSRGQGFMGADEGNEGKAP
jgi:hypothetical protein